jgi:hypothetical protein
MAVKELLLEKDEDMRWLAQLMGRGGDGEEVAAAEEADASA